MKILLIADEHPEGLLNLQVLMQRLVLKHRNCRISLLAPKALQSLARRLPLLDELLVLPEAEVHFKYFWWAGRQLEDYHFDQAIVLTRRWKPALIPMLSGVERRTGWLGRLRFILLNDARLLNSKQFPTERQQYLALADDHGEACKEIPEPELFADAEQGQALLQSHYLQDDIQDDKPVALFCPAAALADNQRWPAHHWSQLAAELIAQGWAVWLMAPKAEQALCEQICAGLDREQQMSISNLAGRLAWEEMIDLMALSRVVVAQDRLFSQFALALKQPLVALSGTSGLQEFMPLDQPEKSRTVRSDLYCQPCEPNSCHLTRGNRTAPCVEALTVTRVKAAVMSMVPIQALD